MSGFCFSFGSDIGYQLVLDCGRQLSLVPLLLSDIYDERKESSNQDSEPPCTSSSYLEGVLEKQLGKDYTGLSLVEPVPLKDDTVNEANEAEVFARVAERITLMKKRYIKTLLAIDMEIRHSINHLQSGVSMQKIQIMENLEKLDKIHVANKDLHNRVQAVSSRSGVILSSLNQSLALVQRYRKSECSPQDARIFTELEKYQSVANALMARINLIKECWESGRFSNPRNTEIQLLPDQKTKIGLQLMKQ